MSSESRLTSEQAAEIEALRSESFNTRRATVPALEEILYHPFPVLDHGFVRVVDYMGNDQAVVQAARVSYGKGTKKVNADRGLIAYLMRHAHTTPFEMCEIKLHVKLPMFVARQWVRHRTANINEYSARYSVLDREFYIPNPEDIAMQSAINRQGRGNMCDPSKAQEIVQKMRNDADQCYGTYEALLGLNGAEDGPETEREGIARELARINLPVNAYTQWYWKIDLHNLLHFLRLRGDPHAQMEIQRYADVILDVVARWVPMVYEAFMAYRKEGQTFSKEALRVIKTWVHGGQIQHSETSLSKREWDEVFHFFFGDNT